MRKTKKNGEVVPSDSQVIETLNNVVFGAVIKNSKNSHPKPGQYYEECISENDKEILSYMTSDIANKMRRIDI